MFSSEYLEYFRLIMSIASLLDLCHSDKNLCSIPAIRVFTEKDCFCKVLTTD